MLGYFCGLLFSLRLMLQQVERWQRFELEHKADGEGTFQGAVSRSSRRDRRDLGLIDGMRTLLFNFLLHDPQQVLCEEQKAKVDGMRDRLQGALVNREEARRMLFATAFVERTIEADIALLIEFPERSWVRILLVFLLTAVFQSYACLSWNAVTGFHDVYFIVMTAYWTAKLCVFGWRVERTILDHDSEHLEGERVWPGQWSDRFFLWPTLGFFGLGVGGLTWVPWRKSPDEGAALRSIQQYLFVESLLTFLDALEMAVPGSGDADCTFRVFRHTRAGKIYIFLYTMRIICLFNWYGWLLRDFLLLFSMPPFVSRAEVWALLRTMDDYPTGAVKTRVTEKTEHRLARLQEHRRTTSSSGRSSRGRSTSSGHAHEMPVLPVTTESETV